MFLSEWREFLSAPCLAGKKNLTTARVSMLLKSRASLTCFRACFLTGHAKDLSAPRQKDPGSCDEEAGEIGEGRNVIRQDGCGSL